MLSPIAASPNTSSQIPFWLQILSIAMSPIIGFIGVAVGVTITERNRRGAYLIDEKKKAYLEFIDMLARLSSFWSNEYPTAARKHADANQVLGFSKPMIESLQRTYLQIRLLGSQEVTDTAGGCFHYTALASITAIGMLSLGFDQKEWGEVVGTGMKLMTAFSDAARRDLGLPNLGSREKPTGELSANELVERLEEIVKITREKSSSKNQSNEDGESGSSDTVVGET